MGNFFGRDGWLMELVERVPLLGYVVSAVHGVLGDRNRAIRAAARCTNSSISVICEFLGFLIAGPPTAVAGAAAGGVLGWLSEAMIADFINDPAIREGCTTLNNGMDLGVNVICGVAGAGCGYFAKELVRGAAAQAIGETAGRRVLQFLAEAGADTAARLPVKAAGAVAKKLA